MRLISFILFLLLFSCQRADDTSGFVPDEAGLSDDFVAFYEQFHQDSAYQMAHIVWPLEGVPDNAGDRLQDRSFRWQKEDWTMMRPIDYSSGEYQREFLTMGSDIIIEKITHQSGRYALIRRFAIVSSEWHLIYYAGVNPVR